MLVVTTFAVCLLGGFAPVVSADLYVLAASALVSPAHLPLLVVTAAAGQTTGKALLFGVVRSGSQLRWLPGWCRMPATERCGQHGGSTARRAVAGSAVVFLSAAAGVPPFFLLTAAAGAGSMSLLRFCAVAFLGRMLRLSALALCPRLLVGFS